MGEREEAGGSGIEREPCQPPHNDHHSATTLSARQGLSRGESLSHKPRVPGREEWLLCVCTEASEEHSVAGRRDRYVSGRKERMDTGQAGGSQGC